MRHYGHIKHGPEHALEQVVTASLHSMFGRETDRTWLAGSLPVGAGAPDILLAEWRPEIVSLYDHARDSSQLLGYLRGVNKARSDTIAARLRKSEKLVARRLEALESDEIVQRDQSAYSLSAPWRSVLPEVITIEVKVKDWRRAVSQAARNSIFSNQSFVALPQSVACRVRREPVIQKLGLGVISIDEFDAQLLRRPKRKQPRAWSYYYQMAKVVASEVAGDPDALRRIH